jgi:phthalate 4,5-dioxygenase oxygenase subunit
MITDIDTSRRTQVLTHEENELLCRVEGDAPMGQLMRRHWTPVCLIEEVSDPDGAPVKARVFGENLVVFRDTDGRVGVLDEACPHRRASLVFGRNEEGGLRCLYHGWKMDAEGNVLEMASEPAASGMVDKVKHKAYPVKEWGGMVWAWFGPQDSVPDFSPPAWAPNSDVRVSIAKVLLPCNWAQILEGAIDSAHSSSLHSSDMVPARVDGARATGKTWLRPSTDKAPRLQVQRGGYGFRYAALRRPIQNAATHDYVRSTVFVAPATALIPPNNLYNVANVNVPMDDTHTAFYFVAWGHPEQTPETETWRRFLRQTVGVDLDETYRPLRTIDNRFWQDRQAMKAGNFTGISGFPNQDVAMWLTMGPIASRGDERLGASDLAIVEFRRQMVEAAHAFQRGEPAIGTGSQAMPSTVCSFQAIVPKTTDWRDYEARHVWAGDQGRPELEPSYSVKA